MYLSQIINNMPLYFYFFIKTSFDYLNKIIDYILSMGHIYYICMVTEIFTWHSKIILDELGFRTQFQAHLRNQL